jgi:hypothetical protein
MITAPLLSMFVVPVVYLMMRRREARKAQAAQQEAKPPMEHELNSGPA